MSPGIDYSDSAACHKVKYKSKRKAREAHNSAHWRIKVYWCDKGCNAFHASNAEKR